MLNRTALHLLFLIRCNKLPSFRGCKYQYDAHGHISSKQTTGSTQYYHYDAEHHLIELCIEELDCTHR
ncbi:hypothetical protein ABX014_21810 [Snodgrassella alvi]|uniref:hypothetical protein n=1 Tax=Snodgrassella alvi TaxID=1196083 RepID=UPI00351C1FBB